MKKFIKYIAILACVSTASVSCESFLDQPVLGQETLDTYFYTEDECNSALIGCYQSIMYGDWWQVNRLYIGMEICTDNMWYGNTTQDASAWFNLCHFMGSPAVSNVMIENFWQYRYTGILRCNLVISKVPEAENVSDDAKALIVAQAKFIRAFHYFELVKCFGGVPIVEELSMPSEVVGITRQSVDSCYTFIENDLLAAIEDLPLRSEYSSSDLGRATKGAAQAYLGKAYLYQEEYKDAFDMFEKVINSSEYSLMPEFNQVSNMDYNNNAESIFEHQTSSSSDYALGTRLPVVMCSRDDSGWSWGLPTSDLENAFIEEGDYVRLERTIIKHGASYVPNDNNWSEDNTYVITPSKHKSARTTAKMYIPKESRPSSGFDGNYNNFNTPLFRYADLLLMYAEAGNQLGYDSEALWALNLVRNRAQLASVTSSGTTLRDDIRNERRLELALEFHRLFDIRRWKNDSGKSVMSDLFGPNGSFVNYNVNESTDEYELTNTLEPQEKGYYFDESRDLLFPIPSAEIALANGSIEQNPGY